VLVLIPQTKQKIRVVSSLHDFNQTVSVIIPSLKSEIIISYPYLSCNKTHPKTTRVDSSMEWKRPEIKAGIGDSQTNVLGGGNSDK
jgi:hypothetical protein